MSDEKKPREFWASHLAMDGSEGGARDWTPKSEWADLRCYVEIADYQTLQAENRVQIECYNHAVDKFTHTARELTSARGEIERLKAKLKHEIEGTVYCPACGKLGTKVPNEFQTKCECGAAWMSARQQAAYDMAQLTAAREMLKVLGDAITLFNKKYSPGENWNPEMQEAYAKYTAYLEKN